MLVGPKLELSAICKAVPFQSIEEAVVDLRFVYGEQR
jgi:hypothetical protein